MRQTHPPPTTGSNQRTDFGENTIGNNPRGAGYTDDGINGIGAKEASNRHGIANGERESIVNHHRDTGTGDGIGAEEVGQGQAALGSSPG